MDIPARRRLVPALIVGAAAASRLLAVPTEPAVPGDPQATVSESDTFHSAVNWLGGFSFWSDDATGRTA